MSYIDKNLYTAWITRPASETFERLEMASTESVLSRLARTITAFLNTSGGLIVAVLSPEHPEHELNARIDELVDTAIVPRPSVEVKITSVHSTPGARLLIVDVPIGLERPYSFGRQVLIRRGESTQIASRPDVLRLIGEHEDPDVRWERQLLHEASETDLDQERIREATNRDEVYRSIHIWQPGRDHSVLWTFLHYFHLGAQPILRNSAIVLFGKNPTTFFPQIAIRVVAYMTEEFHALTISDDKTFSRNLLDNIDDCFAFIDRNVQLSSRFPTASDKSFQRSAISAYPFPAVREAVLNALVHRDFSCFDGSVTIKITPNSLEIWNPGTFPDGVNLDRLEDFRVSRPRNPDIAHVLQKMGYIERLGSGINRIIRFFEAEDLPRPTWEEVGGGVRVTLRFRRESDDHVIRMVRERIGRLQVGEVLSLDRLASILEMSLNSVEPAIRHLLAEGKLFEVEPRLFRVMH